MTGVPVVQSKVDRIAIVSKSQLRNQTHRASSTPLDPQSIPRRCSSCATLILKIDLFSNKISRLVLGLVISAYDHLRKQSHEDKLNTHCEHDHRKRRKRHAIQMHDFHNPVVKREHKCNKG